MLQKNALKFLEQSSNFLAFLAILALLFLVFVRREGFVKREEGVFVKGRLA